MTYRSDIDAMRGIAVLLVVLYHAFPSIAPSGFLGVDVFFVISGYLITSIILSDIQTKTFSLRVFFSKRIRRLFPALIVVLIFVLVLGNFVLFPEEYEQLGRHIVGGAFFWQNFLLMGEVGYFDVESHYKPLLHLWSLSVEEQFYLLWPFLILLFLKLGNSLSFFIIVAVLVSFGLNVYFYNSYNDEVYYHTLTRVWQLGSGALLAVCLMKNETLKIRKELSLFGVLTILFVGFFAETGEWYGSVIVTFATVLVILANQQYKFFSILAKVGLISYPLYLWHWVLISFLFIYLGRQPEVSALLLVIAFSFILATLTYLYIEKIRYIPASTPYLIVTLVLVGFMGLYIEKSKGLPDRGNIAYEQVFSKQFIREPARDQGCIEYVKEVLGVERVFDYCRVSGLSSEKLIAVIGDSHAHVLYPGVMKQAEKYGFGVILLANSSCPTLKGFKEGKNKSAVSLCETKIEQILSIISKEPRIEKVIMATRGPVYINGEVKGEFTAESVAESLTMSHPKQLYSKTYQDYLEGYKKTVEHVLANGHVKKMFYLLENPELDFLPKETIKRPYDIFDLSLNKNVMSRDLYLKRMSIYRNKMISVSRENLFLLDPMEILCDQSKCYSFKGDYLYADDDHFSVFGSEYVVKYFEKEIFQ